MTSLISGLWRGRSRGPRKWRILRVSMEPSPIDAVRSLMDNWNAGTPDLSVFDPYVVWDARQDRVEDLNGVFFGEEGMAEFWRGWLASWDDIRVEVRWLQSSGDRVVCWVDQTMVGKASGLVTEWSYAWDFSFRDGKIIRVSFFTDESEARAAVAAGAGS